MPSLRQASSFIGYCMPMVYPSQNSVQNSCSIYIQETEAMKYKINHPNRIANIKGSSSKFTPITIQKEIKQASPSYNICLIL